jgi:hypothetical protein
MARRRKKRREVLGVLRGIDTLLAAPKGHATHASGTGAHRNRKNDKKARRQADKQAAKGWS